MRARIFRQPKTAMQSGTANTHIWVLEWEPARPRTPDPLMGWVGGSLTQSQLHLKFATAQEAIAYATRAQIPYDLEQPPIRIHPPKIYADNFKYTRLENWTH